MDKVAHAGFYAIQAFLSFFPLSEARFDQKGLLITGILLLVSFSTAMELLQYFVPDRTFDLLDILANAAGVMLGFLSVRLLRKTG